MVASLTFARMMKLFRVYMLAALALSTAVLPAFAAEDGEEFDPIHHVADGYYMDFEPFGKVQLPRIFLVRHNEGGLDLDFFLSTTGALASGEYRIKEDAHGEGGIAEAPSEGFEVTEAEAEHGNPIAHSEEMVAGAMHLDSELESVDGHILVDFSISRHLIFAILGALIVLLLFTNLASRYKRGIGRTSAPHGIFQNMFETLIVFVRDEIAKPTLGDKYRKFLPYLLTAFFFILTCNLIGLFPFGATATSNLMVTAVLAIFTFLVTQFSASRDHWAHIFWPPGVPFLLKFILIPVEILGLFTKPFALAVRLFANMTAGHLVILSLIGLIFTFTNLFGAGAGVGVSFVSVAFALFIYLLEILVAFIQAYVFTMLSGLFIGMAVAEHHHEEPGEGHLPEHTGIDHAHVTPHLIAGDGEATVVRGAHPVAVEH